jgi:hypothetical protein
VYRKILQHLEGKDEKFSMYRGRFNYRMVEVTTLVLECGHRKVYRGDGVPTVKVLCKECRGSV